MTELNDFNELWSWKDVAAFLHVSRSVIYENIRRRGFPTPIKVGSLKRFWVPSEVKEWVMKQDRATYKEPAKPKPPVREVIEKYAAKKDD